MEKKKYPTCQGASRNSQPRPSLKARQKNAHPTRNVRGSIGGNQANEKRSGLGGGGKGG